MTSFEELVCGSEMARAVLSACDVGRGGIASFFYNWQTLISGGLAIAAAVVTVILLRRQIRLQKALADLQRMQIEKENGQKVKAALIGIPHALVEITDYLDGSFEAWIQKKPDERPKPPTQALKIIMDAAAYVDNESFESMRQLIVSSRTFESRLHWPGRKAPEGILNMMIADIAELSYLTRRLFEFGRMEVDAIPYKKPTRADLEKTLNRDFDLKLLLDDNPIRGRVDHALGLRFPGTKSTTVTSDEPSYETQ